MTMMYAASAFGGKPNPDPWLLKPFDLPGYRNATIDFKSLVDKRHYRGGFLISPSSMSEQRGANTQIEKTMSGYWVFRNGRAVGTIALSGYFLETLVALERNYWLRLFESYAQDSQNSKMEYINNWKQWLTIEGRRYYGFIQSLSTTKSGNNPYLYQFNMTFTFFNDEDAYGIDHTVSMNTAQISHYAGSDQNPDKWHQVQVDVNLHRVQNIKTPMKITESVSNILTGKRGVK